MIYECRYDAETDIIEVYTHGKATMEGMRAMIHSIAELCAREQTANILVDHSDLDGSPLSMTHIRQLSDTIAPYGEDLKKRKCAHVAVHDLQFGLVRSWEILVEISGVTNLHSSVFRFRNDAIEWIKSNS